MKIEIKSIFGNVIFEFTKENNTFRDTVLEAVKQKADLSSADLSSANLSYANLSSADLSYADLSYADLSSANLRSAKKEGSKFPIYCKWDVTYSSDYLNVNIGCKTMTIKEWDKFFKSKEEFSTPRSHADFKLIEANYQAVKSFCKTMLK